MQLFDNYDDAFAALPSTPNAGDKLREQSAAARQRSIDSFDRCDTDGFLSQWASDCTASEKRLAAQLADQGGKDVFRVLIDTNTGEIVAERLMVFFNKFAGYGSRTVWAVNRNGSTEWVTDYKRESNYAKKNLAVKWVVADAFVGSCDQDPNYRLEPKRGMPTGPIHYYTIRKSTSYMLRKAA